MRYRGSASAAHEVGLEAAATAVRVRWDKGGGATRGFGRGRQRRERRLEYAPLGAKTSQPPFLATPQHF
jgi:hypothetical protein